MPGAEVVAVSAKTGEGLDELRAALARAAGAVEHARGSARRGSTSTAPSRCAESAPSSPARSGRARSATGDELRVEPAGLDVRVRSVQVHDEPVERAEAGQRVALALPGIERSALHRGDALVEPGAYPVSYRLDVELEELEPIADDTRLHVHHGTTETLARVVRVGERFAQLRLAEPVVAARNDRIVLRKETTLGGGRILDPAPPRRPIPPGSSCSRRATRPRSCGRSCTSRSAPTSCGPALLSPGQLDEGLAASSMRASGTSRPIGSSRSSARRGRA